MKTHPRLHVALLFALCAALCAPAEAQDDRCPGDCNADGRVIVSELVQVVNIGLGKRTLATCPLLDADRGGVATVDEMVLAVERSLNGCPRTLEGPEALRGTSQVTLSTMDSLLVLNFGFASAGGGGGAGGSETILCAQGSKVVARQSEGASCTITTTYADCVEDDDAVGSAVTRDGTLIQTIADVAACTPPGQIPPNVNVALTLQNFTEAFSDSDGTDVELFASALVLAREPTGAGSSRTKLDGSLAVRRTTGERFTLIFDDFFVTEAVDGTGAVAVTQNGRVSVDCIGDLEIRTTLPIVLDSASASCPHGGELEVEETPGDADAAGGASSDRSSVESIATGQQTAVDAGFDAFLFRAANGPVYQVLQNAGADADEGAESVRITTLVGSTGAASACESVAGDGLGATAIAAAASAPFDLGAVRKSAVIRDATPPCFNTNAEDGEGSVCIGPDCGTDCTCDSGERCVAFTFGTGVVITEATAGVPAAQIADLRDPQAGPCAGFAYAFGTAEPTTQAPECAPDATAEGFALPVDTSVFSGGTDGSTIVFAYDAPLLSDFRASHAGFSVDLDGKNRVGCTGNDTLLGLGIADTDRTPPPRIGFTTDGGVTFDFDGRDELLNGLVETCRFPALAACVGPTGTTPTPVPAGCPEVELDSTSSISVEETTAGRENTVGGASCSDGGNQAPDVTFSYTPPVSGFYEVATTGSSFDTLLYVRQGTCSGLELGCNDDDGLSSQSKLVVFLAAAQPIVIAVDGFGGASGDVRLQINAAGAPPTATPTRTPAAPVVLPDLTITAFEAPPNGVAGAPIDVSATVRNLGLREASAFDVGFFLSTNQTITEDDALLGLCSFSQLAAAGFVSCSRTVNLPPGLLSGTYFLGAITDFSRRVTEDEEGNNVSAERPIDVEAAGPTPTPGPVCPERNLRSGTDVADQSTTLIFGNDLGGSACGDGGGSAPDTAYGYTAPASGVYTIDTLGSSFDTLLHVRSETCAGAELACSDDDPQSGTLQSRLTLALFAGQRIVIVVDGFGSAAGNFNLNVRQVSASVPTSTPVEQVATPTPSGPAIRIGPASGSPGSIVSFDVSLATGGEPIAGLQNDIVFDADVAIVANAQNRPDCEVNPVIDKDATQFAFRPSGCVPGQTCTAALALVLALDNTDPIPNGAVLYTCNARVVPAAVGGTRFLGCANPGASRPDGSAIEPDCFAGEVEVVGAPTPTRTPTAPPSGPQVEIEGAHGNPGQEATIAVRLDTAGRDIAGVQNDIFFDGDVRIALGAGGRPDCEGNDALDKQGIFAFQPAGCTFGVSCTAVRAIVVSLENVDPIPDGSLLYTCTVEIGASAALGGHPLTCTNTASSDPQGFAIATGCSSSAIEVTSGSGPTPTPTPTRTPKSGPAVVVGSAFGEPGEEVAISVTLLSDGEPIVATQNDIEVDLQVPLVGCTVNPAIDRPATSFSLLPSACTPGQDCTSLRALVLSFTNLDPIPDGSVLYTCRFKVDVDASPGPHALACLRPDASDGEGNAIEIECVDGILEVTADGGGSNR